LCCWFIARLFSRRPFPEASAFCAQLFQAGKIGMVLIEPVTPERFQSAYRLRLRYRDKLGISFTDLASFAVMQELAIRHVLTGDEHFVQAQLGFRRLPE
jgi:predicted nucleic acid-binding protein